MFPNLQAKFGPQFVKKYVETDLARHASVFPTLWWNSYVRNRKILNHAHHNIPPAIVTMNSFPPTYRAKPGLTKHAFLRGTKLLQANLCCKPEKNSKRQQTHKSRSCEGGYGSWENTAAKHQRSKHRPVRSGLLAGAKAQYVHNCYLHAAELEKLTYM